MEPKLALSRFPSHTSSPYEPNNSSFSSSTSSFETFSTSTTYLPIDKSYSPPLSSPIPIPFSPSSDALRFDIYSSSPLPTKLSQPFIIRPFKAHLEKVNDLLGCLQLSLAARSQSRIAWSIERLRSLDPTISRTTCDVLTRLALGDGQCMMVDYLRWVGESVKECHATLELVKEKEIGWNGYVKSQVDFNLRTAINAIGLADSGATAALLDSLEGWDAECAVAVETILFSNVLNNEERRIEIKRIRQRIMSRQTIFPVDDQPPALSISQLAFLLAPIPRHPHSSSLATAAPSTLPPPPVVASSPKTVVQPSHRSSQPLSNLSIMLAHSSPSTLIDTNSKASLLCEKPNQPSSPSASEDENENDDEDDDNSEPPSFAEYDADDLSSSTDNSDFSSSSNTTLNSTPVSQPSLESQLLLFPSGLLPRKTLSLLLGRVGGREEEEEHQIRALF